MTKRISKKEIDDFKVVMQPLIRTRIDSLKLPVAALKTIEPSQVGTIVGTLMDAMIPYLDITVPRSPMSLILVSLRRVKPTPPST